MCNTINVAYFQTPFGELILGTFENKLCLADWRFRKMRAAIDTRIQKGLNAQYIESDSELIIETQSQLSQYFKGERKAFDIPLLLVGTTFQKEVWNALRHIPYGKTKSYLELSKDLNNDKAIRAVASANGANAISILIPCHRIIGSNGGLIGYAGGLNAKMKLLTLEDALNNDQLKLF